MTPFLSTQLFRRALVHHLHTKNILGGAIVDWRGGQGENRYSRASRLSWTRPLRVDPAAAARPAACPRANRQNNQNLLRLGGTNPVSARTPSRTSAKARKQKFKLRQYQVPFLAF